MRINRLVLYNFSSYEGTNEFDFHISEEGKNIILIGGQNGAGKTSLFSAIKIGLYGPLAFGHRGVNPHYIQKIKEHINANAFQNANVEASVSIDISIMAEREIGDYSITRFWKFENHHLEEIYTVERDRRQLNSDELNYFENYLHTIIPPGLFEFFLFDGEEVGNIFATSSYNRYIKKALFTLCDMDVFETIRKFNTNYLTKSDDTDTSEIIERYDLEKERVRELKAVINDNKEELKGIESKIQDQNIELQELEEAFKKSGGITEKEKQEILGHIAENEKKRNALSGEMKSFIEEWLPFIIVSDFVNPILDQLDLEEKSERFQYVVENVKHADIEGVLLEYGFINADMANALYDAIIGRFRPENYADEKPAIHDLSREQKSRVYAVTSMVSGFDKDELLDKIDERSRLAVEITRDKEALKNAMGEEDAILYSERINQKLRHLEELKDKQALIKDDLQKQEDELKELLGSKDRTYQEILERAQNQNIYKFTSGISKVMLRIIDNRTEEIKKQLELLTVQNLNCIYRKDNLITHIEIDDNFEFHLYQNESYTLESLLVLMNNYGGEEFSDLIGRKGLNVLYETFAVSSLSELRKAFNSSIEDKTVDLFRKVELGRISKGERQIFILALYWAIIKISGQKIPFIIDTPYARVDAVHRKAISEQFFPNISEQVIILSTDEEINEEYYRIIKPFVAKEYLLSSEETTNRTFVLEKYFYEV